MEIFVKKRGCGWPKEGGVYMVSEAPQEDGALARVVLIDPPVPVQRKPHRGPILVDGAKILGRAPEDEWVVGTSAKTVERNKANDAWENIFGMSLNERLLLGDCVGFNTADAAYQHLLDTVSFHQSVVRFFREIAVREIQNLPNAAKPYDRLVKAIQKYALSRGTDNVPLVDMAAACWQLFNAVPRSKRGNMQPVANLLGALGLTNDARELHLVIRDVVNNYKPEED